MSRPTPELGFKLLSEVSPREETAPAAQSGETVNNSCEVCFAVCRAKTRVRVKLGPGGPAVYSCDKLISIYDL